MFNVLCFSLIKRSVSEVWSVEERLPLAAIASLVLVVTGCVSEFAVLLQLISVSLEKPYTMKSKLLHNNLK